MKTTEFKNRLQSTRHMRGITQAELALTIKTATTSISHFEIGTRKPSYSSLERLADALEVSVDYLMGRTDSITGISETYYIPAFKKYLSLSIKQQKTIAGIIDEFSKKN